MRNRLCKLNGLVLLSLLASFATAAPPAKMITINLDFNNANKIKDSDGVLEQCAVSGLTDAQQTAIQTTVQKKYEDVYGAGKVTVNILPAIGPPPASDGTIVFTNSTAPGGEYGDAGAANGPTLVYLKQFSNDKFDITKIGNYAGETASHEVGHRLGVAHNGEKNTLMSKGSNVTQAQREADGRSFLAAEAKKILDNSKPGGGIKKDSPLQGTPAPAPGSAPSLGWISGHSAMPPPMDPNGLHPDREDDSPWDSEVSLRGAAPGMATDLFQVGYINSDNEFFQVADPFVSFPDGSVANSMYMSTQGGSFLTADMALYDSTTGLVYDYSKYGTDIALSEVNPNNSATFLQADVGFNVPGFGSADVNLDADYAATGETTTGGFVPVPEPTMAAVGMLTVALTLARRRPRSRAAA